MNKAWQIWLVLALIFCAGGVSGGLVAYHIAQKDIRHMPPPPQEWGKRRYQRIDRVLHLTREQREEVQPIVQRTTEELVKLRRQDMRKAWEIVEGMQREIATHLTPAQKVKFEEFLIYRRKLYLQRREQRAERAGHHPPPAGAPNGPRPPPPNAGAGH